MVSFFISSQNICCRYSVEATVHEALLMSTHNICLVKNSIVYIGVEWSYGVEVWSAVRKSDLC